MARRIDHAAIGRRIRHHDAMSDPAQPQALHGSANTGQLPVDASDQRDFDRLPGRLIWCFGRHDQPTISSTVLPRFAAMSSGVRSLAKASMVARTTLMGLREP